MNSTPLRLATLAALTILGISHTSLRHVQTLHAAPAGGTDTSTFNTPVALPQWVFDQWADPSVSTINMPKGSYYLRGSGTLSLRRSNVTVNFSGCDLVVDPADKASDSFYPIVVESVPLTTPTFGPSPTGAGPATRTISHLHGPITASTTQLTMDSNELIGLTPGETVLIWAGVTPTDPVEPEAFIPATVAGVNNQTGVITFSAPIGRDIADYGSLQNLSTAVAPDLQWKVGNWGTYPSSANFSKGFGRDHGLERFKGGLVHDVTFNDLTMRLNTVSPDRFPHGMWEVSAVAVQNFTMTHSTIVNPHGSVLHLWKAFNSLVDGMNISGVGSGQINNWDAFEAYGFTLWGGDGLVYRNIDISGTDIGGFNAEVNVRNVHVDGFNYNVSFTAARTYPSPPLVFGFFSASGPIRITNATVAAVTTGGSTHSYFSYSSQFVLDGALIFPGSSLTDWFDFGYQRQLTLNGTVKIGGVVYGPAITKTLTFPITHGASSQNIAVPKGIYASSSVRMVTQGDIRDISDSFGASYWNDNIKAGQAVALAPDKWQQIGPGDAALAQYLNKSIFIWLNNNGSAADGRVDLIVTYLPISTSNNPPAVPKNFHIVLN